MSHNKSYQLSLFGRHSSEDLFMLEREAIAMLQKGERLALSLNPNGYYLAFSGGKDSAVLYYLAKKAGVQFRAFYNVTTIDPPENVYYIREHFQDVEFVHPPENFFWLVSRKGLPTMNRRYCCAILKESDVAGWCALTGVRADESRKRSQYDDVAILSRRKENQGKRGVTIDQIEANEHRCIQGKDAIMLRPILHWSDADVWAFHKKYDIPLNPVYEHSTRVGCMFCPFAKRSEMQYYIDRYPKYWQNVVDAYKHYRCVVASPLTVDQYIDWWRSKRSLAQWCKSKHIDLFSQRAVFANGSPNYEPNRNKPLSPFNHQNPPADNSENPY